MGVNPSLVPDQMLEGSSDVESMQRNCRAYHLSFTPINLGSLFSGSESPEANHNLVSGAWNIDSTGAMPQPWQVQSPERPSRVGEEKRASEETTAQAPVKTLSKPCQSHR